MSRHHAPREADAIDFDMCGEPITPRISRRGLLGGAGVVATAALARELATSDAWAQAGPALPGRSEFVLRGGYVLTMDAALGDLEVGDVHVRDGGIVAVGARIDAPGAEIIDASRKIVMPGLIDTHWHCWNSLQRNWLTATAGYMVTKNATAKHYGPTDFYNSDMLAFAEAINAGVTCTYNYAHNVISPAHAQAEMKAHADSGIRGIYGYGCADLLEADKLLDLADLRRTHAAWSARPVHERNLVKLGVALRGPRQTNVDVFDQEMRAARELDLPVIFHGGQSIRSTASTADLKAKGYMTRDLTLVHFLLATEADRRNMAEAGVSLSYTVDGEQRQRVGVAGEQLLLMVHAGVNVTLSFDGNSISPVDLFSSMREAWNMGMPKDGAATEKLEGLDFRQCLAMGTINGAKALGLEKVTGSLTPGKRADVILVRADDLNMAPFGNVECALVRSATAANVDTVVIDGRIMKRGGRLAGVDAEAVKRAAAASAFAVQQRAGGQFAPREAAAREY